MSYKSMLPNVKAFVFDVDGVLTNGTVFLTADDMVRKMHVRDGLAMKLALSRGFQICVITGGNSPAVQDRLSRLGINDVYMAIPSKTAALKDWMKKSGFTGEDLLYMGDDLPDWHAMQMCGVKTCPADAADEIKSIADYVSDKNGGRGCVRDVIEQTLKVQSKWFNIEEEVG